MAGEIVHVEFPAEDSDRAQSFWSGLFGWSFSNVMPEYDYRMAQTSPQSGAAVYKSDERDGYPRYYFASNVVAIRGKDDFVRLLTTQRFENDVAWLSRTKPSFS